ncbi:MAG: LLM class flavin-dependent oxidoreductase, partial [Candidatus Eremiobacteraeota bacterium]|nr:LLM class flavin-dependent oxidoreductase [Candidatus Eremiobacteraeota bacterium]
TSLERNAAVIKLMDELDFDEAWIGEHHSAGTELIAEPFMFITYVAAQTKRIKLGTGVLTLPYHNPLWVADRAILADHLTRGRFMLGLGPGSLPTDAIMIGLDPSELRQALHDDADVLFRLIDGETVTAKSKRYDLVDARCQLAPYADPSFEIAVAATASQAGPLLAGRYGAGLLSLGATAQETFDVLALHWDVYAAEAQKYGKVADRSKWRLVGPMHIAETKEQAIEDVRYGFDEFCEYTQKTLALPTFRAAGATFEERIAWINETGLGVIGSPEDAVKQIKRLEEQSGGFGCYMTMANDWANWEATKRHYELFARHVMPHFQQSMPRMLASETAARARQAELDARNGAAIHAWTAEGRLATAGAGSKN